MLMLELRVQKYYKGDVLKSQKNVTCFPVSYSILGPHITCGPDIENSCYAATHGFLYSDREIKINQCISDSSLEPQVT